MPDAAEPNPTVARRRLAVRLRKLREEHGRGLEDLATFLRVALPQASRLDTGARGFPARQVVKLADWYRLTDSDRAELLVLVAESRKRAWWQQVELADSYRTLIGMEQVATSINEYGSSVVPGLLQTGDYARASAGGDTLGDESTPEAIEGAAQIRIRRQQVLDRREPPVLRVVIDEAVLARRVGGRHVMGAQLAHLEEMSTRPGVSIQVIGFDVGAYPYCSRGHYILVQLEGGLPDVLYRESIAEPEDTSDEATLAAYWRVWEQVRARALDRYASRSLIREYRSMLDQPRSG